MNKCLTIEPVERPTAEVLLTHPFMKKAQGKRLLSELVANWIDQIEAHREERAENMKNNKEEDGEFGSKRNQGLVLDKANMEYLDEDEYTEDMAKYTKSGQKYTTNESGTMIVKKTPDGSTGKNSGCQEDVSPANTGSIVYHENAEDNGNEFENYMKMLKEFNQKYDGDRQHMETEVAVICRALTYNQRIASIEAFESKKNALQIDMDAEIAKIKQKYTDKINSITKIMEHKKKLDLLRCKFKEIGENIDEMDCMKDIGEKSKYFKRENTFESKDGSMGPSRLDHKEASISAITPTSTSQYVKKLYKIGEKNRIGGGISSGGDTEPVTSILSNISKLKKMNSNEKNIVSSRAALNKAPGSPTNHTPKGASQLDKKNQLSSKNLLTKKPLVSYVTDRSKTHQSSADKLPTKSRKGI